MTIIESLLNSSIYEIDKTIVELKKLRKAKEDDFINHAKYKVGDMLGYKVKINGDVYDDAIIKEIRLYGGFIKERYTDDYKFSDYKLSYVIEPVGDNAKDTYSMYEHDLLRIKM